MAGQVTRSGPVAAGSAVWAADPCEIPQLRCRTFTRSDGKEVSLEVLRDYKVRDLPFSFRRLADAATVLVCQFLLVLHTVSWCDECQKFVDNLQARPVACTPTEFAL